MVYPNLKVSSNYLNFIHVCQEVGQKHHFWSICPQNSPVEPPVNGLKIENVLWRLICGLSEPTKLVLTECSRG